MHLYAGKIRSQRYIRTSERMLVHKMASGYELIAVNLVKFPFVESQEECVVDTALESGYIELVNDRPRKYQLTDAGWALTCGAQDG